MTSMEKEISKNPIPEYHQFSLDHQGILENTIPNYQISLDQQGLLENPIPEYWLSLDQQNSIPDYQIYLNQHGIKNPISEYQSLDQEGIQENPITDYTSIDQQAVLENPVQNYQQPLEQNEDQTLLDVLLSILPSTSNDINPFYLSSTENNFAEGYLTMDTPSITNTESSLWQKLNSLTGIQSQINYFDSHKMDEMDEILKPSKDIESRLSKKRNLSNSSSDTCQSIHACHSINNDHSYSILEKKCKIEENVVDNENDDEDDDDDEEDSLCASSLLESSFGPSVKRGSSRYLERRKKNNIASKRSRESRKTKFVQMEKQAEILEKQNEELRKRITLLEQATLHMKEILVTKLKAK